MEELDVDCARYCDDSDGDDDDDSDAGNVDEIADCGD